MKLHVINDRIETKPCFEDRIAKLTEQVQECGKQIKKEDPDIYAGFITNSLSVLKEGNRTEREALFYELLNMAACGLLTYLAFEDALDLIQ